MRVMDFTSDFQSLESISSGYSPQRRTPGKKDLSECRASLRKRSAAFQTTFVPPAPTCTINNNSSPLDDSSHGGTFSHFMSHTGVVYGASSLLMTTPPTLVTWEELPLPTEPYMSEEALERRLKRAQRHWKRQRLRWCILSTRHICIRRLESRVCTRTAWQKHVENSSRRAIRCWRSHGFLTVKASGSVASAVDHYQLHCLKRGLSALKSRLGILVEFRAVQLIGDQYWRNKSVSHALSHWDRVLEISSVLRNQSEVADNHYSRRWIMIENNGGPSEEEDHHNEKKMGDHVRRDLNFSAFSLNGSEEFTHRGGPHPRLRNNNLSSNSPFAAFRHRSVSSSEYSYVQRKQFSHYPESPFAQYKRCSARRGVCGDYYSPRGATTSLLSSLRYVGQKHHRFRLLSSRFIGQETHLYNNPTSLENGAASSMVPSMAYPDESSEVGVCQQHVEEERNTELLSGTVAPISVVHGMMMQDEVDSTTSNIGDVKTDLFCHNRQATAHFPVGYEEGSAVPEYTEFEGGEVRSVSSFDPQRDELASNLPSSIETASLASSLGGVEISTVSSRKVAQRMTTEEEGNYSTRRSSRSLRLQKCQSNYSSNYERAKRLKLRSTLLNFVEQSAVCRSLRMQRSFNYERAKRLRLRNALDIFGEQVIASRSLRLQSRSNDEKSKRLRFKSGLKYFIQGTAIRCSIRLMRYSNYESAKRMNLQNSFTAFEERIAAKHSSRLKGLYDSERATQLYLKKGLQKWLAFQKKWIRHAHQIGGGGGIENVNMIETMLLLRKGLNVWLRYYQMKYLVTHCVRMAEKCTMVMVTQRTLRSWRRRSYEAITIRNMSSVADHFNVELLTKRGMTSMQMSACTSRALSAVIAKHQLSMVYRSARYALRWWEHHARLVRFIAEQGCRNRKWRCIFKWHRFVTQCIAERTAFNQARLHKVLHYWQLRCSRKCLLHLARSHFSHLTRKKTVAYWVDAHRMRLMVSRVLSTFQERFVMRVFQMWLSHSKQRYLRHSHQYCNRLRIDQGEKHWQTIRLRKGLRMLRHLAFVSGASRTISKRRYFLVWWTIHCTKKRNMDITGGAEVHHRTRRLKAVVSIFLHRKRHIVESNSSILRAQQHFYWYTVAKRMKSFLLLWFRHVQTLSAVERLRNRSLKTKTLQVWSARSHYLRESKGKTFAVTLQKEGKLLTTLCRFLENASSKHECAANIVIARNNFISCKLHKVLQQWQFRNCQTRAMKTLCKEANASARDGTFGFDATTTVVTTQKIPNTILHDLRFINLQTRALQYSTSEAQNMLKWWKRWAVVHYVQYVRLRLGALHCQKRALCSAWKYWKKNTRKTATVDLVA